MIKALYHNQKGQSLLELLVALFILVAALVATTALITTSINAGRDSRNQLIAANLAREAIEAVRNIRDSNWVDLALPDWNEGLSGDTTAIPVIDNVNPVSLDFTVNNFSDAAARLKISNSQYLQGAGISGSDTQFYRLLTIGAICRNDTSGDESFPGVNTAGNDCAAGETEVGLKIIAEVRWPSPNSSKKVIIEDRLYNWQTL